MRKLVLNEQSAWPEQQLRFVLRVFCERAMPLVNDVVCKAHLEAAAECAAAQWSEATEKRWQASGVSPAQFLREQILRELDAYAARLDALEAAASQGETWKGIGSSISR